MATYEIKMNDGSVYHVDAADNADPTQIAAGLQQHVSGQQMASNALNAINQHMAQGEGNPVASFLSQHPIIAKALHYAPMLIPGAGQVFHDAADVAQGQGLTDLTDAAAAAANGGVTEPVVRKAVGGATKVAREAMGTPSGIGVGVASAILAPEVAIPAFAAGAVADPVVQTLAQDAGVPDEYADAAGLGAGLLAGYATEAAPGIVRGGVKRFSGMTPKDPQVADAVKFLQDNNYVRTDAAGNVVRDAAGNPVPATVDLSAADATGNKFVRAAQKVTDHSIGGSEISAKHYANQESQMKGLLDSLAKQTNMVEDGTPEGSVGPRTDAYQAGTKVTQAIEGVISQQHQAATEQYAKLKAIESDPTNQYEVQTGTKKVPTGAVDDAGNPLTKQVPVMETMGLPVDLRPVKEALRPLRDQMMRQLPVTQQQASLGLKALNNIMDGGDFAPASTADADLSAIKSLARTEGMPELKSTSQTLASQAVMELERAVQVAVSRARKAGPSPKPLPSTSSLETVLPEAASAQVNAPAENMPLRSNALGNPAETSIRVPGTNKSYGARYALSELGDLQASHNGQTFQSNPKYALVNDRDYANPVNQEKIVSGSAKGNFDPSYLVNDNPDASNGAIVTDKYGNVLGGNGRKMILDRVYKSNPEGAAEYRDLLAKKAEQFGIDPADIARMKQPVLTRVVDDAEFAKPGSKQAAITDFNKRPTADLTPSERAIADSRRVSPETMDDIAARLERHGGNASLADVLEGKNGLDVLNNLMRDGVISPQERASFAGKEGLTKAGRQRLSDLMIGRYFSDPAQLDSLPGLIRQRLERIAAPLARVEQFEGWGLTRTVKDALNLIEGARARSNYLGDSLKQGGLFGEATADPKAVALAERLQTSSAKDLAAAAKQYAGEASYSNHGGSLFGDAPKPEESFAKTFGELKGGEAPVSTDAAEAQAPAEQKRYELPPLNPGAPIGQEAAAILRAGRDATIAKYKAADVLDSLGSKGAEGIQVFNKAVGRGDVNINALKAIKEVAPQAIPELGRGYLESMFDLANAKEGLNHSKSIWTRWANLGKQTKEMLFPNSQHRADLDKFFLAQKQLAKDINPSNTASTASVYGRLLEFLVSPVKATMFEGAAAGLSKLLYSPKGVKLLTEATKVPAASPHGKVLSRELQKLIGASAGAEGSTAAEKVAQ